MRIDVTKPVTDLKGEPIPLGGISGQISRIVGMAVTVPSDPSSEKASTVGDLLEMVLLFRRPNEELPADDMRKAYKLARRVERADPWFDIEIDDSDFIVKRAGFLPTVEFGFLDELIEDARAEARAAEKAAEDARNADSAHDDENRDIDPATA